MNRVGGRFAPELPETPEEAYLMGRHYEAQRIARLALADAEATDQRPQSIEHSKTA